MVDLSEVIQQINTLSATQDSFLIAIDGIGGSGKSTIAGALAESLNAQIIEMDSHYSESTQKHDIDKALEDLLYAKSQNGITIVEGVYSMHSKIRDLYDYKIWIECDPEIALERGIKRSGEEEREIWTNVWQPNELAYIKRENPSKHADLVLDTANSGI